VFNPIGGALSDRTRSRFGRRAPWLICAPAVLLVIVARLGSIRTVPVLLAAWCLAQSVVNLDQAPLTAVIPDRVAVSRRGAASSVAGVASFVGGVAGVGLASADRSASARIGSFLSALTHRDFACVFASRGASILGYFLIIGYELYILTDYIRVPAGMRPAQGVTVLAAIAAVGALLAAAVAGPLSDRLNRRKPFVFLSSAIAGAGCVLPVLSPTFSAVEIYAAFAGLAFGTYLSVDAALVTLVVPRSEDTARDLGVLKVANAGPRVLAPLFAALIISHPGRLPGPVHHRRLLRDCRRIAVLPVRSVR
jgi:MFS family permease